MHRLFVALCLLLPPTTVLAQTSVPVDRVDQVDMKALGLEVTSRGIINADRPALAQAVVDLGVASGVFLSSKGLLLTSSEPVVQSLVGAKWPSAGFLSRGAEEEMPLPALSARVLVRVEALTAPSGQGGGPLTDSWIAERVAEAEGGRADYHAEVTCAAQSWRCSLHLYQRLDDIRLVYLPPAQIGEWGEEADRLGWPRAGGDFAFLRAWAAADGTGREPQPGNVPFTPRFTARLMSHPLRPGLAVFSLGYASAPSAHGGAVLRFAAGWVGGEELPRPMTLLGELVRQSHASAACPVDAKLELLSLSGDLGRWPEPMLGDVPLVFRCGLDASAAGPGAPLLNAWGELVGVATGGPLTGEAQPLVANDLRYLLLVLERLSGAEALLKELRVSPDPETLPSPWVLVLLRPKPELEPLDQEEAEALREGHMAHVRRMRQEQLVATGELGNGSWIVMLRSPSMGMVLQKLRDNPLVASGRMLYSDAAFAFSVGSVCAVDEGAGEVDYQIVRFDREREAVVAGGPWADAPFGEEMGRHVQVLAAGTWGWGHIGFAVLDAGSVPQAEMLVEALDRDPQWKVEVSSLRVERGSFCARAGG